MKFTLGRFFVHLRVLLGGMRLCNEVYSEEVDCSRKGAIERNKVLE